MRKFFKKLYDPPPPDIRPHNSVESIEDLPRDSEDELEGQPLSQGQHEPGPQLDLDAEIEEPAPSISRTLVTIRMNPLGRPFSNIYQSIDSPQYDTYSEESKDKEELTDERSRESPPETSGGNNNGERVDKALGRDPELEPLSIEDQEMSENCIVKCFCMKRRR